MGLRTYLRRLRFRTDVPYRVYDRLTILLRQLGPYHPLRKPADDDRPSPFFIVGSGRSGTTLLRAILAGSREVAIPPESYVMGAAVRDYRRLSFLPWPALVRFVLGRFQFHPGFEAWATDLDEVHRQAAACPEPERSLAMILDAIYMAYAGRHRPEARRWGDKTPANVYHLPRLDAVFPGASYVHVLRDGRDVVASYLEAGLYDSAEDASERWIESVNLVRSFLHDVRPDRSLEVRYERLVRDPEAVTRRVCEHLALEYRPEMVNHRDRVEELGDTDAGHHAGLHRPIDDRSVGTWRDRLDERQRRVVEERLASRLVSLGYSE